VGCPVEFGGPGGLSHGMAVGTDPLVRLVVGSFLDTSVVIKTCTMLEDYMQECWCLSMLSLISIDDDSTDRCQTYMCRGVRMSKTCLRFEITGTSRLVRVIVEVTVP